MLEDGKQSLGEAAGDWSHFFFRLRQFKHPDRPRVAEVVGGSSRIGDGMTKYVSMKVVWCSGRASKLTILV